MKRLLKWIRIEWHKAFGTCDADGEHSYTGRNGELFTVQKCSICGAATIARYKGRIIASYDGDIVDDDGFIIQKFDCTASFDDGGDLHIVVDRLTQPGCVKSEIY